MAMEKIPSFSVIIPNRNGAATLGECLEAVFRAEQEGLEVIVVDDASDDDSLEVAGRYPVRVVRHETCRGASAARNSGAAAGRGEILLFIDSDVAIPPDTFEVLKRDFSNPEIGGVVGRLGPFTRFENLCSPVSYTHLRAHET